jgi:hypothetical protein
MRKGRVARAAVAVAAATACVTFFAPARSSAQEARLGAAIECKDTNPLKPLTQVKPGEILDCEVSFSAFASDPGINFIRVTKDATSPLFPPQGVAGIAGFVPQNPLGSICQPTALNGQIEIGSDVSGEATIEGNAICSGAACNPVTGVGCSLPCLACNAGANTFDPVTGLTCPAPAAPVGVIHAQFVGVEDCRLPAQCPGTPLPGGASTQFAVTARVEGTESPFDSQNPGGDGSTVLQCEAGCPFVEITKTCETEPAEPGQFSAAVSVTVSNRATATAPATNCMVADIFDGSPLPLSAPCDAKFDLAPGQSVNCTANQPIDKTTKNDVTVTCDPVPAPPPGQECQTTDMAEATCATPRGDFKCYAAKLQPRAIRPSDFRGRRVSYSDQFTDLFNQPDVRASVLTPHEICNPVDKNGEGIADPDAHLMCYKLLYSGRTSAKKVIDTDQFGAETLRVTSPVEICLPAVKNGVGDIEAQLEGIEARLNHYACYRAATEPGTDPFDPRQVSLTDQFEENKATTVTKTALHCNPILTKDERNVTVDPSSHLKCYDIQDPIPFRGRTNVTTDDQWYSDSLQVGRATRLCETATKELLTPLPPGDLTKTAR